MFLLTSPSPIRVNPSEPCGGICMPPHATGTREEYWQLYDHAPRALKSIDGQLRVGGPATAQAAWIPEFLEHCRQTQTPAAFVTMHSYPQDEFVLYPKGESPSTKGDFLKDVFQRAWETVEALAPGMEIHWTEWNPLSMGPGGKVDWVHNPAVDSAYGGAFVARHCVEADDLCESMAYWTASDIFEELGMPHAPFTGTYGLLTIHGIPKATFHAMALVKRMEGERLKIELPQLLPPGCGVVATRTHESIRVLLWNSPRPSDPQTSAWKCSLSLPNPFGRAILVSTRLGDGSGSADETWTAMGRPHNLSPIEEKLLQTHAQPAMGFQMIEDSAAAVEIPIELGVNEVLSVEILAAGAQGPKKGAKLADIAIWDAGMGEAAKP